MSVSALLKEKRTEFAQARRLLVTVIMVTAILGGGAVTRAVAIVGDSSLGAYVVVLRGNVQDPGAIADEHAASYGVDVSFIYRHALAGYAARMSDQAAALISADLRVQSVLPDTALEILVQTIPTGVDRVYDPNNNNSTLPGLTINGVDDKRVDADIAIIDTGIDNTHPDLNVVGGIDCTQASSTGNCVVGFTGDDGLHGTHVAGIAAALDNGTGVVGVAPGARLWAVDVCFRGTCPASSILAGIDWVTQNSGTLEVANISLGHSIPPQPEWDLAIHNSVAAGVTYSVAAGNSGQDAAAFWPANSPDVMTVSNLADADGRSGEEGTFEGCPQGERDDHLASDSNNGPVIDVAAPGTCIYSTIPGGGYFSFSGTSMAAPHVAGAAALLASRSEFHGNPSKIKDAIQTSGNFNYIDSSGDLIQEPLLEVTTFIPVTVQIAVNVPPTASFTKSCSGATCNFASTSTDSDGTISSWSWTFGDGTTGSGPTLAHTYSAAGKYTVTLRVVDNRGASSSVSKGVNCQKQKGKLSCK